MTDASLALSESSLVVNSSQSGVPSPTEATTEEEEERAGPFRAGPSEGKGRSSWADSVWAVVGS
jgi:hypothetical protein